MNSRIYLLIITYVTGSCIIFSSCNDDNENLMPSEQAPSISSFSKDAGYPGDSISILGEHLDKVRSITINNEEVKVVRKAGNEVIFIIDHQTTSGELIVEFDDGTTSVARFFKVFDPDWEYIPGLPNNIPGSLWSHQFINVNTGYYSDGGTINKTTDGGETWKTVLKGVNLTSFQAIDKHTLWVQQDSWNAKRSTNAGDSWTDIKSPQDFIVDETYFFNNTLGWTIGSYVGLGSRGVLKTTDGGLTWNESYRTEKQLFNYRHTRILCLTANTVMIPDPENNILLKTLDGGENWEEIAMDFGHPVFPDETLYFTKKDQGWLYSNKGLFKSTDGGRSWASIDTPLPDAEEIISIHFDNAQNGIMLGKDGAVLRTQDGGTSWTLRYIGSGLVSVDHVDEDGAIIGWTGSELVKGKF